MTESARRLGQRLRGERPEPRGTLAIDRASFEVKEGEAFAIIGPNGAGKSTALKLVSRISYPTRGRVRVRGRVAALIEVGSGVHPELTARENIWLYGQILGMPRTEIRRRFDDIVGFAELAHVLDTPVKMYSSGMQLRLGFAIASHLDPDIFVVDEALAVGDAGFQARCVERMTKLVADGKTLLFVSHNLYAVEGTCRRGIYMERGCVVEVGPVKTCLATYTARAGRHILEHDGGVLSVGSQRLRVRVRCEGPTGFPRLRTGEELRIVCDYESQGPGLRALFHFGVTDGRAGNLLLASQVVEGEASIELQNTGRVFCRIPTLPLMPRIYEVWGEIRLAQGWGNLVDWQPLARFVVDYGSASGEAVSHAWTDGPVRVHSTFWHEKVESLIEA